MLPLPFDAALPLAHAGEPDPTGFLFSAWKIQPTIALGLFAMAAAYVLATGALNRRRPGWEERTVTSRQRASFFAGLLVLLAALGPPLDDWSDHYLLLAHMTQHLLLMLLASALVLYGLPGWFFDPLVRNPVTNRIGYLLTRPIPAYVIAAATMVLWHVPALYEAALFSDALHAFEHATFFLTSLLAWWPILSHVPAWPRMTPPLQCLYFFALTIPGSIVGAFITFAEPGLYRPYDTAARVFGIDLATDQQLGGLLMWVVMGTIYLLLITYTFLRWSGEVERADLAQPAAPRQPASAPRP